MSSAIIPDGCSHTDIIMMLLSWLTAAIGVEAITVGTIGTQLPQANIAALEPSLDAPTFCLDTANKANASGVISTVSYCYTPDSVLSNPVAYYQSTVGVYRPVIADEDEERYELVGSFVITENLLRRNSMFRCSEFSDFSPIEVQTGDVIGICSMNFDTIDLRRNTRRLVFIAATANERDTLRCDNDLCGSMPGILPRIADSDSVGLTTQNQRAMLISANIVNDPVVLPPDQAATSSESSAASSEPSAAPPETAGTTSTLLSHNQLNVVIVVCTVLGLVLLIVGSIPLLVISVVAAFKINRIREGRMSICRRPENDYTEYPLTSANYRLVNQENDSSVSSLASHPNLQRDLSRQDSEDRHDGFQ